MSYGVAIGVQVISASWGGAPMTTYWNGILDNVAAKDINLIIASGNNGANLDTSPGFPACYKNPNALTVDGYTQNKSLIDYGNYGSTCVDVAAPGDYVFTTDIAKNGLYTYRGGTSMSAPLVAGTIALMLEVNPNLSAAERANIIVSTVTADSSYAGKLKYPGRLNVKDAVYAAFCAKAG
eukprot:Blabericola_migrator_1__2157@NODE_1595_length_4207_cov_18_682367_g1043_i0_p4_GENE_NODE_1595_length_4207_cov_18_682367_g1043_i0NODE_1595_length_4207_cov_18_682367_g1043_i0_p4_ORF_typecomplete_len180_score18_41Peptidase_S8/PF00082_22/9_8e31_NODE_1595_length_4207_cov_18_682367_g1043_i029593498